jgi:hypothetical protein
MTNLSLSRVTKLGAFVWLLPHKNMPKLGCSIQSPQLCRTSRVTRRCMLPHRSLLTSELEPHLHPNAGEDPVDPSRSSCGLCLSTPTPALASNCSNIRSDCREPPPLPPCHAPAPDPAASGGATLDTEFMPMEYFSNFDYQSFDIGTIDPMPSLFWTRNMSPWK